MVWGGVAALAIVVIGVIIYTTRNVTAPQATDQQTPSSGTSPAPTTIPQSGAPTVSTNYNASPTDTTAIVTGSVVPNGAFTNYWYEYGPTANLGSKTANQSVGSGFAAIAAPGYITGLVKDTTYYFRLVAESQYGRFAGASYSFQTTHGNLPPVGGVPTAQTLAASSLTRTSANLNGNVTPNKVATTYWFEFGTTANLGNTSALVGVSDTGTEASISMPITGLDPATTYYFRMDAQNQFGTVNGSILTFKTDGPVAIAAPTATTRSAASVSASTATLRASVVPNGPATTYWFEYSKNPLSSSVDLLVTSTTIVAAGMDAIPVSTDITNLASSTTYYFRVVAQNTSGTVRGGSMTFQTRSR
jgi:hypothetical protein